MEINQNPKLKAHPAELMEYVPVGARKLTALSELGISEHSVTDINDVDWAYQPEYLKRQQKEYKNLNHWQITRLEKG